MNMMNNEQSLSPSASAAVGRAPRGLAEMLGVTAIMTMLRRRMVLVAVVGFAAALGTLAFMLVRTPTYTATSLLILSPRQANDAAAAGGIERVLDGDLVIGLRPSTDEEREGLDIVDHGERAYG